MTYEQRLKTKVFGLTTFETDIIQVFKILHITDHVDKDKFFYFCSR